MNPAEQMTNAMRDSGLLALGYTESLRSADGTLRVYNATSREAYVKLYIKRGEVYATLGVLHFGSLMTTTISEISFPHPRLITMLDQLEAIHHAWRVL